MKTHHNWKKKTFHPKKTQSPLQKKKAHKPFNQDKHKTIFEKCFLTQKHKTPCKKKEQTACKKTQNPPEKTQNPTQRKKPLPKKKTVHKIKTKNIRKTKITKSLAKHKLAKKTNS